MYKFSEWTHFYVTALTRVQLKVKTQTIFVYFIMQNTYIVFVFTFIEHGEYLY